MADKNSNLIPGGHKLTLEEQSAGGKRSAEVRKEKATMKKAMEWLLNSDIKVTKGTMYEVYQNMGIDIKCLNPTQLATLGLWYGAVTGNASNYKTMMEANNEVAEENNSTTPTLKIEVIDNSKLEGAMYEENKHNKNDNGQ